MAQLTYPQDLTNAFAGMLADDGPRNDVLSRVSEEATSFPAGVAVVRGTDPDKQALLPTGAADLLGVALHSHANEVGADGQNLIDDERAFNVLHEGRVFVELEGSSPAVTPATAVFIRTANPGAGEGLGRFRGDNDGGDAGATTGCRFLTSGQPGDVVVLEIDAGATVA